MLHFVEIECDQMKDTEQYKDGLASFFLQAEVQSGDQSSASGQMLKVEFWLGQSVMTGRLRQ